MITELRVHNFRSLINAVLPFERRHLLIGKNNSGKTNVCLAISFLKLTAVADLSDAISVVPGAYSDFCNYGLGARERIASFELACSVESNGAALTYRYELRLRIGDPEITLGQKPPCDIVAERLIASGGGFSDTPLLVSDGKNAKLLHERRFLDQRGNEYIETRAPENSTMLGKLYELETNPAANMFRKFLRGISFFNLSAERIRNGWRDRKASEGLWTTGDSLAQVIYQMKTASESRYRRVLDRIHRIEPKLTAINFLTGPEQSIVPIVEMEGGRMTSWASLSDGTLRLLGLSYLIEQSDLVSRGPGAMPPVVIVEEPENSIFVGELRTWLDEVDDAAPLTQFIVTTHSPYLIDLWDDSLDAVTMLARRDWHTESRRLSDQKDRIEEDLQTMPLGEQYFREMFG